MLHKKDKAVQDLENQLKTQKRTMDAQVMELTQTVLEKDSLLMEYMNNSSQQEKRISASDNFFHTTQQQQQDVHEARLQMAQVRQYMYSSSDDDDEDDEVEVLHMSYSSDEDDDHIIHRHSFHSQHMVTTDNTTSHRAPHSPADTISSHVSYSSEDEEQQEKRAEIKHFSYSSVQSPSRPISLVSGEQLSAEEGNRRISQRLSGDGSIPARFSLVKETNSASWPMPPPTPPPSEPLPPVPVMEKSMEENSAVSNSTIPPPRRARSKTMARSEAPQVSAYTTSIHQTNDLPRIMPEAQPEKQEEESAPIPPPRKDHLPSLLQEQQEEPHTKWMDDPESEEDDLWCDPKPHQEWGTATAM
ncbi:uncharacterized protein B0P05DRAFT_546755 [Gilbertella persicaria]|uniref:uncharacterized protein n=1 Tax=Gilbertella persicaria TaxID=101096 RepID=UPI00221E70F4|nr:uncharacterized protein B0P05DRAFT_546755 [Gilbertella persicaria]KAI8075876.1 hypothetical protein B0P05DRAFT_546755 [Gilbertella persicaria]